MIWLLIFNLFKLVLWLKVRGWVILLSVTFICWWCFLRLKLVICIRSRWTFQDLRWFFEDWAVFLAIMGLFGPWALFEDQTQLLDRDFSRSSSTFWWSSEAFKISVAYILSILLRHFYQSIPFNFWWAFSRFRRDHFSPKVKINLFIKNQPPGKTTSTPIKLSNPS